MNPLPGRPSRSTGILLAAALALAPAAVHAAVFRVPTEIASVRVAVQSAGPGDTVQVVGNGGATYEESDIRIDKDLTIQGGWRVDFQVRDPDTYVSVIRDSSDLFDSPLFRIIGPHDVVIEGVWLWGGKNAVLAENGSNLVLRDCVVRNQRYTVASADQDANRGGGLRIVGGSAVLERCRIHSITTSYSGSGFAAISASPVVLRDVQIDNCVSSRPAGDASGGAVYVRGVADFRVERGTFLTSATVQDGGLLAIYASGATFTDTAFTRGLASRDGGAVFLDATDATFDRCTFDENRGIQGGAIHAERSSTVIVRDTRFFLNRALEQAGAFWTQASTFVLLRTEFDTNFLGSVIPSEGGSVYALASSGTVTDSKFVRERSRGKGGVWFQVGGDTHFLRTRFEGNDAAIFGGALAIELGGRATLDQCLLARNSAKFGGSISASFTGRLDLSHCTLTEGTGRSAGGAIYVDTAGIVRMTDTIACCSLEGEVVYCAGGGVTADHCDVWNDDSVNIRVEWGGGCPDPTGSAANLKLNPQLCLGDPDYRIATGSPCTGTASDGGDRGWLAAGCPAPGTTAVEPTSWGRVKASWRSP